MIKTDRNKCSVITGSSAVDQERPCLRHSSHKLGSEEGNWNAQEKEGKYEPELLPW